MTRSGNREGRPRAALFALAFFALGLLAARLLGWISPAAPSNEPPAPTKATPTAGIPIEDAGAPRILFDPSSISLLPDASLKLELPGAPDAGLSPP